VIHNVIYIHNTKDNKNVCLKFENGKPEEILKNDTLCPYLEREGHPLL